jgi:hypothetical protein
VENMKVEYFINNEIHTYYPKYCFYDTNYIRMRMEDGSEIYLYGNIKTTEIKKKKDTQ